MTLFAGALLRTIEFVMATTDASIFFSATQGKCFRVESSRQKLGNGPEDPRERTKNMTTTVQEYGNNLPLTLLLLKERE